MTKPSFTLLFALAVFLPLVVGAFRALGGRRGMLASLFAGWLFLPWFNEVGRAIPVLHSKEMFVPAVVLAVSLVLDWRAWSELRWRLVDVPVAVICFGPFLTSLSNGLGAYDGAAAVLHSTLVWGAPYVLGRVYLGTPAAQLDAARSLVLAGLAYVPFCLWEIRMSPQLHRQIYGFSQHSFQQHVRDGHYRPMLFMAHGLMVAMFMGCAALVAYWLWRTRRSRFIGPVPASWAVVALAVTTLLCRSVGASVLMVGGIAVLEVTRWVRTPLLIVLLALLPAGYCTLRISDWDYRPFVAEAERWFGPNRAQSLRSRLMFDQSLKDHDMQKPWLGWGKWSGSRLRNEEGRDVTVVDSMWILTLGTAGLTGLVATGILLALPLLLLLGVFPVAQWSRPAVVPAASFAVVVGIWAVDDLFNAMTSPVFPLLAGAVVSFTFLVRQMRLRPGIAPRGRQVARAPAGSRLGSR